MTTKKTLGREKRRLRVRSRVSGTAEKPRLCVFRSTRGNYAMLIDDKSGKTLASASDMKEAKKGNMESAKKTGQKLAEEAKKKNIETCVFDKGGYKYHGKVKAIAEGAREGGLKF